MKHTKDKEWNKGNLQLMAVTFDNEKTGQGNKKFTEYIVLNNINLSSDRKETVMTKRGKDHAKN